MPLASAPGPFSSSMRSMICAGTRFCDTRPYMPLKPTSVADTAKPRIWKVSSKPLLPVVVRTDESLISVSAAVRACWSSMSWEV